MIPKEYNLKGNKYDKWEVLEFSKTIKGFRFWRCKCDCGTVKDVRGSSLIRGKSKSCGCTSRFHETHGLSRSTIYERWVTMIRRCNELDYIDYKNYGGRGIRVCEEWENDFISFYEWSMENGYEEDLTIDRIDNNGDYTPNNCRWTDRVTQANNRRNSINIKISGEIKTLAEWCRYYNIGYNKAYKRYRRGVNGKYIFK